MIQVLEIRKFDSNEGRSWSAWGWDDKEPLDKGGRSRPTWMIAVLNNNDHWVEPFGDLTKEITDEDILGQIEDLFLETIINKSYDDD